VERGEVTVIPVAKARWGFGGGGGGHPSVRADGAPVERPPGPAGEGGGGGGGLVVAPVGFIEVRDDGARFRRIVDQQTIVGLTALALVGLAIAWRLVAGATG
jgi:uncharacterized spore protein YtfJ